LLFDDEDIKSAEVAEDQFWDTFKESPTISATRLKARRMAATTVVVWVLWLPASSTLLLEKAS
jgi:hypothetical protein